jgi:HipA-like protein
VAVLAVQQIRRMRGGAQGQLMLGADGHVYVVKFQNNPQHTRVLANELMASRLAAAVGLTVPEAELVEVSSWLIENTPELEIDMGRMRVRCKAGLQFGSRFAGGMMPGQVVDFLPEAQIGELKNLDEFAGILALDKWTGNANGRQAVFTRRQRERRYKAVFIDFGYCFHAGEWRFEDAPLRGVFFRNDVYREVRGWESFEPWLTRVETMPEETVWAAANSVPPEWYGGDQAEMETLVEKLLNRRSRIRELIEAFWKSDRKPFPKWGMGAEVGGEEAWKGGRWGDRMRVN